MRKSRDEDGRLSGARLRPFQTVIGIKRLYRKRRKDIEGRLAEFVRAGRMQKRVLFGELAFCILTAQAKALEADRAIRALTSSGLLFNGPASAIAPHLKRVRFWRKKAAYIVEARVLFLEKKRGDLARLLKSEDVFAVRDELVRKVKGIGCKEASHFLRNVGRGKELAILDRYILRYLHSLGVIGRPPENLSYKRYFRIEKKMSDFSKDIGIPMDHLDLLLWSDRTGFIFK